MFAFDMRYVEHFSCFIISLFDFCFLLHSCINAASLWHCLLSALLAATLRTYQRAGCDSEQLSLSCPRGTSISIELAQYGRAGGKFDCHVRISEVNVGL